MRRRRIQESSSSESRDSLYTKPDTKPAARKTQDLPVRRTRRTRRSIQRIRTDSEDPLDRKPAARNFEDCKSKRRDKDVAASIIRKRRVEIPAVDEQDDVVTLPVGEQGVGSSSVDEQEDVVTLPVGEQGVGSSSSIATLSLDDIDGIDTAVVDDDDFLNISDWKWEEAKLGVPGIDFRLYETAKLAWASVSPSTTLRIEYESVRGSKERRIVVTYS